MAASSLDLGVVQLILSSDSVRSAKVRVSTPNMVAGKLETATHQILPGQKPLRFDWKHRIPVYPGSHAWEGLENALGQARSRPGAATIAFAVIDVDKGTEVAKATVDLARLSSYGAHEAEAASQTLNVNDAHGRAHGQLIKRRLYTVRFAFDADDPAVIAGDAAAAVCLPPSWAALSDACAACAASAAAEAEAMASGTSGGSGGGSASTP